MQGIEILFINIPFDSLTDKDRLYEAVSDHPVLIKIAEDHQLDLKNKGIETFEKKNNLLITEKGYELVIFKNEKLATQILLEQKQMIMN